MITPYYIRKRTKTAMDIIKSFPAGHPFHRMRSVALSKVGGKGIAAVYKIGFELNKRFSI